MVNRDDTFVNSHIQMPKLLLKRFHNDKNLFCYYDVVGGFVGTKGSADSTNTELGYYSKEMEDFLRDRVETPFGAILAYIDKVDFDQDSFLMTSDFDEATRNFIHALMARDPIMAEEANEQSVFLQFLPEQVRHDLAARSGIAIAKRNKMFEEYTLTFLVNRTEIPFVLPLAGIYNYSLNGHSVINLPVSPKIAICLVHKDYDRRMIREDGCILMFEVTFPDIIMKMNTYAFNQQKERNWGRVVCPCREELDRLVRNS